MLPFMQFHADYILEKAFVFLFVCFLSNCFCKPKKQLFTEKIFWKIGYMTYCKHQLSLLCTLLGVEAFDMN